jgi:hypothetical protein
MGEIREQVDVNLAINTGEMLAAAAWAFKLWLDRKKIPRAYVVWW